jgi:outer membrane receptor protein involved in Fe transport
MVLATTSPSRVIAGTLCCAVAATAVAAGAEAGEQKRSYRLPRGEAAAILAQFATESGRPILFMMDAVRGEQTNALTGSFTPREALDRLLAGTALVAVHDPKSGGFIVNRRPAAELRGGKGEADSNSKKPLPLLPNAAQPNRAKSRFMKDRNIFGILGVWLAAMSPGAVQPAPAGTNDSVVELSPFVVSTDRDNGYMAADTINSGRLSTNLLMTPSDTSVITRDLLDDLGVFSLEEATGWLTSSKPTELGAIEGNNVNPNSTDNSDSGSTGSLRGMSTQPSTRNYFASATTPLEYNVERVEGARGPNAILYGEGGPGGQINYLTKKARNRNFGTVRARADSEGSMGVAVDINRVFGPRAAGRYNGSWFDGQGWQSRVKNNHVANALSLVFRPYKGLSISLEADKTRTYRSGTVGPFLDSSSRWNRVPVMGRFTGTTAQATASGLTILGAALSHVYAEGSGVISRQGNCQTIGTSATLVPAFDRGIPNFPSAPDRKFNANPEDIHITADTRDLMTAIEQRFGNGLVVELAAASAKIEQDGASLRFGTYFIDPNFLFPDGSPNPNFGKTYSQAIFGRNLDGTMRDMKALRLAANYSFKILGGEQNLSVIGQRQEIHSRTAINIRRIVDNPSSASPITNNANLLYVFRYWDNLPTSLPNFSETFEFRNVPEADSRTRRNTDSLQIGTSGSYLRDRLSLVGGFRHDQLDLHTSDGVVANRDPITGAIKTYTEADYHTSNNSFSGGVVYFPFELIGVYANISDGFSVQTNANPRIDGSFSEVGIVPATVKAGGLRFRLFGGKMIASAGYYRAKESNSFLTVGVVNINNLWRNHPGNEGKIIETFHQTTTSVENITDTQSREGWGWEGEMTANLGNAFRLTANVAFPHTKQSNVGRDFRAYVAANIATWQRWAADVTSPVQQATDILNLRLIKEIIDNFQDGRRQNGNYDWRANIFGTYFVRSTVFKGTRLGLGAQFFGPCIIGNQVGSPYDYIFAKTYHTFAAVVGHSFRMHQRQLDVQLNVINLLDYGEPIVHGVNATYNGPHGYKYLPPRAVRLTATFSF